MEQPSFQLIPECRTCIYHTQHRTRMNEKFVWIEETWRCQKNDNGNFNWMNTLLTIIKGSIFSQYRCSSISLFCCCCFYFIFFFVVVNFHICLAINTHNLFLEIYTQHRACSFNINSREENYDFLDPDARKIESYKKGSF